MKKIPTLFNRVFEGHKIVDITDEITPGCEAAFKNGIATIKIDGACCAVIDGVFYKRYDAKNGKKPPEGAIPCCDPDPVTGHWPHWVRVDENDPNDRWFVEAYNNAIDEDTTLLMILPMKVSSCSRIPPMKQLVRISTVIRMVLVRTPWRFMETDISELKEHLKALKSI